MTTFRLDPETGEFLEASEWEAIYGKPQKRSKAKGLGSDIDAFVSPIDGQVVSGRAALREHNKKHGVTNIADYSEGYFEKSGIQLAKNARGQTAKDKKERCEALDKTLTDLGA